MASIQIDTRRSLAYSTVAFFLNEGSQHILDHWRNARSQSMSSIGHVTELKI